MSEQAGGPPPVVDGVSEQRQQPAGRPWLSYFSEDLPRTVMESTDSALRSARSLPQNSSNHLRTLQDAIPQFRSRYKAYEDVFFNRAKDGLVSAKEHSAVAGGIAVTAALLLMRGPRRFLFRQTLGRLQSEETRIAKAAKSVEGLMISVELMKKESQKLHERAALAEKDMQNGYRQLKGAGSQIQSLSKAVRKAESEAHDLMNFLRQIPGTEALKRRADVASMASFLRDQRIAIDKKIMMFSELGIRI